MNERRYQIALSAPQLREGAEIIEVAAQLCGVHPSVLQRFVDLGLIEPIRYGPDQYRITHSSILRVKRIERLRRDLGVNLLGAGIILDLVDKIEELRREVEQLRCRL